MDANDVIGRVLVAEKDALVYDYPGGPVIGQIKKGNQTAPIYSWIEYNGAVYWMFDYTIPGQAPGAYYVEHAANRWDLLPLSAQVKPEITAWSLPSINLPGANVFKWIKYGAGAVLLLWAYGRLKR